MHLTQYSIPSHLQAECQSILAWCELNSPHLRLNMYHTVHYNSTLTDAFCSYYAVQSDVKVTVETVTRAVLPTHRDVFNDVGDRMRLSHCVLNCESKPITVSVDGVELVLLPHHWFLLNSQTRHGAVCEPPHRLICVDTYRTYPDYCGALQLI